MKLRWHDYVPLAFAAAVLLAALAPMPAWVMDIAVTANLTFSVLLLFTVLRVRSPFQLHTFPAILVAATMGRLALNLASTRLILAEGDVRAMDAAGGMIRAFGEFVAGDDLLVGMVMFAIIVIVQFVVITKGAERVSEVAARFALDALPGRQAAIDADVAAGAIDEKTARRRRRELARQADFHGAMDGAGKFVRGDAIAGLVITFVNLFGGWARSALLGGGMDWSESWAIYGKLAIGDGLASQTPAVLIAVSAAFLATRNPRPAPLGVTLARQMLMSPEAFLGAGGFLLVLLGTPLPKPPLMLGAAACVAIGLWRMQAFASRNTGAERPMEVGKPAQQDRVTLTRVARPATPNRTESRQPPTHTPLALLLGRGLVRLAKGSEREDLTPRLTRLRERFAQEFGFQPPPLKICDDHRLPPDCYAIRIHGETIAETRLPKGLLVSLIGSSGWARLLRDAAGPEVWNPAIRQSLYCAPPSMESEFRQVGARVLSPVALLCEHVRQVLHRRADDLLDWQQTREWVRQAERGVEPDDALVRRLHEILARLLREGVPVHRVDVVLNAIDAHRRWTIDESVAACRRLLSRSLCGRLQDGRDEIQAWALEASWEASLQAAAVQAQSQGLPWRLGDASAESLRDAVERAFVSLEPSALTAGNTRPTALVVNGLLRPTIARALSPLSPQIMVLSRDEIAPEVRVRWAVELSPTNRRVSAA